MATQVTKKAVSDFWNAHPLGSYEIPFPKDSKEYFQELAKIRSSSSGFVREFYEFENTKGKKVLDVGCGPGWISFNYAANKAFIFSIDIALNAVKMAKGFFDEQGLNSHFHVADAENLPFKEGSFDFVISEGVLHHTPNAANGLSEIYRVLKKGGKAAVSFYEKNWLLSRPVFPITLLLMRLLGVKLHGAENIGRVTPQELARMYDGIDNPLGDIKTRSEWEKMLKECGFVVTQRKRYYFPARFFRLGKHFPSWLHCFLDRTCGTMVFFKVEKK